MSEAYSIHHFKTRLRAHTFVFEMDVSYWIEFKMVDFLCTIDSHQVGVSVTRAMGFPHEYKFTQESADRLIDKKLDGLIIARNGVTERHSFFNCILHVWCQSHRIATLVKDAFDKMNTYDEVFILCTVCDDPLIYRNRRH